MAQEIEFRDQAIDETLNDDHGLDILLVDDDDRNIFAIQIALGDLGGRIAKAKSGDEALRRLLDQDFALILLDVHMPGLDGFQTARMIRMRERNRHVPIIFLTAFNHNDADIRRGYELGAVDYLFKPLIPEVLRAKARVFVELRRRSLEVARQAQRLRAMQRAEDLRKLAEERQRLETEALKRKMEEQRQANERLEEMDRRKDEFIAVLAHELRNPLAPIVAGLELLRLDQSKATVHEVTETMARQTRHLTRLVDDLLDVSRVSRGKIELSRQIVDLGEVVEQTVSACRHLIESHGHRLAVNGGPEPVLVAADPVRLVQVLSNLVNNAARYTDNGGRIEITWGHVDALAVIEVVDNGRGIPKHLLNRVFDRFVQEQTGGDGLGLGLTLVKQLVELHGGTVSAHSEGKSRGSRFVIELPVHKRGRPSHPERLESQTDVAQAKSPASTDLDAGSTGLHILLIEDDDDVLAMIHQLLQCWGHEVQTAADGPSGLSLAVQNPPQIVILDLGLPGIDGFEVARRIRRVLGSGPRLIAMSGFGQPKDRADAKEAGFDDHLVKPADPARLRQLLRLPA